MYLNSNIDKWRVVTKRASGFTLLEVLTVISIIVILATMALPAIAGIRRKAYINQTSALCHQVALACRDYMLEYGAWPDMDEAPYNGGEAAGFYTEVSATMVRMFLGENIAATAYSEGNRRKIVFMEISPKFLKNGGLVDRWGNPIRVKFDADFDNYMTISGVGTLNIPVAVWSAGPDGNYATWGDNPRNW